MCLLAAVVAAVAASSILRFRYPTRTPAAYPVRRAFAISVVVLIHKPSHIASASLINGPERRSASSNGFLRRIAGHLVNDHWYGCQHLRTDPIARMAGPFGCALCRCVSCGGNARPTGAPADQVRQTQSRGP